MLMVGDVTDSSAAPHRTTSRGRGGIHVSVNSKSPTDIFPTKTVSCDKHSEKQLQQLTAHQPPQAPLCSTRHSREHPSILRPTRLQDPALRRIGPRGRPRRCATAADNPDIGFETAPRDQRKPTVLDKLRTAQSSTWTSTCAVRHTIVYLTLVVKGL